MMASNKFAASSFASVAAGVRGQYANARPRGIGSIDRYPTSPNPYPPIEPGTSDNSCTNPLGDAEFAACAEQCRLHGRKGACSVACYWEANELTKECVLKTECDKCADVGSPVQFVPVG